MEPKRAALKGPRGQFWSFDAVFAIIIFMSAITIIAIAWLNISNQLSLTTAGSAYIMQLQAQQVAQNMLSAGSPTNWQAIVSPNSTGTWTGIGVGLASSPGSANLVPSKLYALQSMVNYNYTDAAQAIGTSYDYYITITGSTMNITMGKNPVTNGAVTTFLGKRDAQINGVPVQIEVFVWSASVDSVS